MDLTKNIFAHKRKYAYIQIYINIHIYTYISVHKGIFLFKTDMVYTYCLTFLLILWIEHKLTLKDTQILLTTNVLSRIVVIK